MTKPAPAVMVRVDYDELRAFVAAVFAGRGLPGDRAQEAAAALCYGDLAGHGSHGVVNLTGLYLPLLDAGRADPRAQLEVITDRGAAALVDAHHAVGLWAASEAMSMAVDRANAYGIGLISLRAGTHFGCAGYHATQAVRHGMVGIVASNCGRQRIVRPPGGQVAMLGTNPLSVAAPAGGNHPFVLDMSTTAVAAGRVRQAAQAGRPVPPGWLADDEGNTVTDAAAFDRHAAHLQWLGSGSDTGAYKGFGLGLMVEVLAALVPGAGVGPSPEALSGKGAPSGRDDDIGFLVAAIAPGALRAGEDFERDAHGVFAALLACPPVSGGAPVGYPGWPEGERARHNRRHGVPLAAPVFAGLRDLAARERLRFPDTDGDA